MGQQSSVESKSPQRFSVSSIQIEAPDPGDVPLPPEFRIAVYENLILQIEKTGKFQHVYRSGDKNAANVPDLVTLHTRARAFTEGSQKKREVTTVMGATSLTVNVRITDHASQSIVERDIKGRVVLMGENLGATYDFSSLPPSVLPGNVFHSCDFASRAKLPCLPCGRDASGVAKMYSARKVLARYSTKISYDFGSHYRRSGPKVTCAGALCLANMTYRRFS